MPLHADASDSGPQTPATVAERENILLRKKLNQAMRSLCLLEEAKDRYDAIASHVMTRLAVSEAKYRLLAEQLSEALVMTDLALRFTYANPAFFRLFSVPETEAEASSLIDLAFPGEEAILRAYLQSSGSPDHEPREFTLQRRDGSPLDVLMSTSPLVSDSGEWIGILALISDLRQHKQLEEAERKAEKLESLGILAAGVAHNINNVLAIIMGTATLRAPLATDPLDREAYQRIELSSRQGREVVNSLIQFGRPTLTQKLPLDLHQIIRDVRFVMDNRVGNRIKMVLEISDHPLWILGDSAGLQQALVNLCLNALDAMPNGGTLTLHTDTGDLDWANLEVVDDGCGMPPAILARVMEPFFTTKTNNKGTGLGLSMTYGIVKVHGGTLDITSEPGKGTRVGLRIPRIPAPLKTQTVLPTPEAKMPGHVMLVDDDNDVRFLLARMLNAIGVPRVETMGSGEEGIAALRSGSSPDLVILDQNMPGMDGIQTMAQIRRLKPDLPILISSGQPEIESWDCFKRPGVAVIAKPFDLDEITARLAQMAPPGSRGG
jgi:PAS domain S-box-containing protein